MGRKLKAQSVILHGELLRRLEAGESINGIAKQMGVDRKTVRAARDRWLSHPTHPVTLPVAEIEAAPPCAASDTVRHVEYGTSAAEELVDAVRTYEQVTISSSKRPYQHTHRVGEMVSYMGVERKIMRIHSDGSLDLFLKAGMPHLRRVLPDCCAVKKP